MRDFNEEFKTIDLLEKSDAESRGIDCFALAVIKVERQARKLFTFLIFQYPCFNHTASPALRDLLHNKRIYAKGILEGIDRIAPTTVKYLIGEEYEKLFDAVRKATTIRNKIFHGQITDQRLSRAQLFEYVHNLRSWCNLLGNAAEQLYGYDGFRSNSYQKSAKANAADGFKFQINSIQDYEGFLRELPTSSW